MHLGTPMNVSELLLKPLHECRSVTMMSAPNKLLSLKDRKSWLFWPRPPVRQKFRKLQKLWTGPWVIESFKTPLVVVNKHSEKRTRQTVHVDRLLPCTASDSASAETDSGVLPDTSTQTEEIPLLDSQPWDESQSQSQSVSESSRPTRTRRRPAALEPYILS